MSCQPAVDTTRPLSDVDGETASITATHEQRPPNIRDIMTDKLRDQHEASQQLSSPSHLNASPTKCNGISSEFNTTTMMTPTTDMHPPLDQEVPAVDTIGPQHCDKNKQHADATSIPMAQDQQSACPARQMASTTAKNSSSSYSNTNTTELTGLDGMNQTDAISETPSGHTEFRVPMAKSSKIEEENNSPPTNRRAPQRKASVFSHDGFLGIHQLDQSAIKQHSSLQDLTKESQQELQVNLMTINNNGTNKIEDFDTKMAGPTVAPAPPSSSPQRPTRSDTLGSTGSSRASSCDEPTIVSTPSSKNGSQQMVGNAGQLNRNSSSSTDSSLDSINNGSSLDDSKPEADHPTSPVETMETKNDDDVFDSKSKPNSVPVFQSIKTQLKRNSVPDAKFITQHIEKLISQNEAIIENWDQVSIRSYNSQANGSQSSACTPSPATTSTNDTTQQLASKRPSKRWSTTSLQTNCGPIESSKAADNLVEARLRRRSQHATKRPSIRPNLHHGASALLSPNFVVNNGSITAPNSQYFAAHKDDHHYQHPAQFLFGSPTATSTANTTTGLSSSVPSSPRLCTSSSTFLEIQKFLHGRLNSGASDNAGIAGGSPACTQLSNPIQFSQNIEKAIKSLSLKRNEEERQRALIQEQLQLTASQHQRNLLMQATQQPEDLVMASMLSHYNIGQPQQQQQIFKEQHVNPISSESEIAAAILSHYQQQQALEQLKMTRLAEYQQQQLLTAAALHQQQQIQIQQQQHQQAHVTGELVGREGLALERQPRDSQVLNEFLARMMLGRDVQPSNAPTDTQIHSQPHPIVMHNNQQQQASEMFTQPLDSATPAHRCNDCDIPFWTRDLLNYHLMTSCSARTGPQPNRPIAFNFGQPNGFDQASNLNPTNPSLLVPPSAAQLATETALSLTSKSVSPPKWPPSQNSRSQDHALTQLPVATTDASVTISEPQKRLSYAGNVLVAPKSPHKSRESAELAWQQRLTELCILKQQLIETNHTTALNSQTASSSSNSNETQESNLPIKKRKISEPNMRY